MPTLNPIKQHVQLSSFVIFSTPGRTCFQVVQFIVQLVESRCLLGTNLRASWSYMWFKYWSRPPSLHPPPMGWVGALPATGGEGGRSHLGAVDGSMQRRNMGWGVHNTHRYIYILSYVKHILYVPNTTKYYIQKT